MMKTHSFAVFLERTWMNKISLHRRFGCSVANPHQLLGSYHTQTNKNNGGLGSCAVVCESSLSYMYSRAITYCTDAMCCGPKSDTTSWAALFVPYIFHNRMHLLLRYSPVMGWQLNLWSLQATVPISTNTPTLFVTIVSCAALRSGRTQTRQFKCSHCIL